RMDQYKINNILVSVSNKPSIDVLLPILKENQVKIWATEGTAKYIREEGMEAQSIVSGFDFDGLVKSLDKLILARILADKYKPKHLSELKKLASTSSCHPELVSGSAAPFSAVVVELYKLDQKNFPESMDVGGVTLIRAAIKNFENVALAYDRASIKDLTDHLISNQGSTLLRFRKGQAKKAIKFISERCKLEADLF
ncbi:hypothetical protein HY382_02250, partial [Candidatus Curtissbacteria bacterium]|nr:hypothetical protein [Candidatus Curtissbacteria bacterium]